MPRLRYRGLIVAAALVVALDPTRPADAQVGNSGPTGGAGVLANNLVIGAQYDIANQAKAEQRLRFLRNKLRRDSERGHSAAAERDVRLIDTTKYRIAVDEWLIRKNTLQDFGYYPIRTDPVEVAALAQAARLPEAPIPSQSPSTPEPTVTAPTMPITIINAGPAGPGIGFQIGGTSYQSAGGSRQSLTVASASNITYDGGGSLGQQRYLLSTGLYEFRPTPDGWALYKLADTP